MSNNLYWSKIQYLHYTNTKKQWVQLLGRFKICPNCVVLWYDGNSRKCWILHVRNYYKQVSSLPFLAGKKWYFVTKIVLTYCEKKIVLVIKKNLWNSRPRIFRIFEITRTIYSNSERSEQFLVTECFFNLFLEVSQI